MKTPPPSPDLHSERRQYSAEHLLEEQCPDTPWKLFEQWLGDALQRSLVDATAMLLATVSDNGQPSARTVLLKQWDEKGLVFYTGYTTRKGRDLEQNPRAGLVLHWRETSRQIHIEAIVERVSAAQSERYFSERPRDSQLAARAATPPGPIASRAVLDQRFAEEETLWESQSVPKPNDWGGYLAVPQRIEFWQGRTNRLHDRIAYARQATGTWQRFRLNP